ncbi:hypothetical protein [Sphingomonas aracearum]|uniref:hypothetical protein n=1 Tax=Sphingomonas aracearum TaxID=2283317 RepID=UPI0015EFE14E|nr:hypothetical protein [Sphingomonas aracearum]
MRLRTTQDRQIGPAHLRFVAERRLVFRPDGARFVAELTLDRVAAEPEGKTAERYRVSQAGLLGRTLRFRLDASGHVLSLDDLAGHWEAQAAGLDGTGTNPLRAFPPERQLTALASLLLPAIAPDLPAATGTSPVKVPLAGAPLPVDGTETFVRTPEALAVTTQAAGSISTPLGNGSGSVSRERLFDPATGLLRHSEETTRMAVNGATGTALETVTTTRNELTVS